VVALVFAGKDLILLAKTGPKRTDAFTLPIPQELLNNRQAEQAFFNYMLSPMRSV
jgi:superfamily II DNA/RNA helicase